MQVWLFHTLMGSLTESSIGLRLSESSVDLAVQCHPFRSCHRAAVCNCATLSITKFTVCCDRFSKCPFALKWSLTKPRITSKECCSRRKWNQLRSPPSGHVMTSTKAELHKTTGPEIKIIHLCLKWIKQTKFIVFYKCFPHILEACWTTLDYRRTILEEF